MSVTKAEVRSILAQSQLERATIFRAGVHAIVVAIRSGQDTLGDDIEKNLYATLCQLTRVETLTTVAYMPELSGKPITSWTGEMFVSVCAQMAQEAEEPTLRSYEILQNLLQHIQETAGCLKDTKQSETPSQRVASATPKDTPLASSTQVESPAKHR